MAAGRVDGQTRGLPAASMRPHMAAGLFQTQLFHAFLWVTPRKVFTVASPAWVVAGPVGGFQYIWVKLMVPLNAENAAFPGHGVQWLTCFSKLSRSLFQGFSIWIMGGVKPFSKSFKGPFQPFPDGLPGLGCGAAFGKSC